MSRQQVAFLEECRKNKGCGSLKEDFYTRFIPENDGFWAVTWLEKRQHFGGKVAAGVLFLVIIEWNILNVVDIMSVYVTKNMSILGEQNLCFGKRIVR